MHLAMAILKAVAIKVILIAYLAAYLVKVHKFERIQIKKRNENIQKKEGVPGRFVSNNNSHKLAMKVRENIL